jgi:hypothetical protein
MTAGRGAQVLTLAGFGHCRHFQVEGGIDRGKSLSAAKTARRHRIKSCICLRLACESCADVLSHRRWVYLAIFAKETSGRQRGISPQTGSRTVFEDGVSIPSRTRLSAGMSSATALTKLDIMLRRLGAFSPSRPRQLPVHRGWPEAQPAVRQQES